MQPHLNEALYVAKLQTLSDKDLEWEYVELQHHLATMRASDPMYHAYKQRMAAYKRYKQTLDLLGV